ncbi:MAG: HEAT repeat domain-containing protein [Bacteroidota bacterium]
MKKIIWLLFVVFSIFWISNVYAQDSIPSIKSTTSEGYKKYVDSINNVETFMPYFSESYHFKTKPQKTYIQLVKEDYQTSFFAKILIFLLVGLISIIFLFIIGIPAHKIYYDHFDKKAQKLRLEFLDELIRIIFDEEYSIDSLYFKKIINSRFKRKILTQEIIKLHSQFIGIYGYKLEKLFFDINLDTFTLKKVKSQFWYIRAKGFREVAEMGVNKALPYVENNLNQKNIILKVEARIAWTKLNPTQPVKYLEKESVTLTEWGKLHVFGFLLKQIVDIDPYLKLLDNKNTSVVIFGLQTVGLFKRFEYIERIGRFLASHDERICAAAIIALGNIDTEESSKVLIDNYDLQTPNNQTSIVQIVSERPCTGCLEFFAKIIEEGYINRSLNAVKGLLTMKDFGEAKLKELLDSNIENLEGLINQIKESNTE